MARLKNPGSRDKISDGRRRPGESIYRHPSLVDHEGAIVWAVFGLMFVLLVLAIGIGSLTGQMENATYTSWAVTTAFVAPLTLSAVFGGLTLSTWGWVPGLVLGIGFELVVVGSVDPEPTLRHTGIVLLVVGTVGFFVAGKIRGVPMWIGRRGFGSKTIDDGRLPGESEPGVLDESEKQ